MSLKKKVLETKNKIKKNPEHKNDRCEVFVNDVKSKKISISKKGHGWLLSSCPS